VPAYSYVPLGWQMQPCIHLRTKCVVQDCVCHMPRVHLCNPKLFTTVPGGPEVKPNSCLAVDPTATEMEGNFVDQHFHVEERWVLPCESNVRCSLRNTPTICVNIQCVTISFPHFHSMQYFMTCQQDHSCRTIVHQVQGHGVEVG
jgi:hypothetical protein